MDPISSLTDAARGRWTPERAWDWHRTVGWLCGFNFVPSSAVNFLEMWRAETFAPDTITRELGWAAETGFNSLRTNLHFLVWRHDPDGLLDRLDRFLDIAAGHGLGTVLCPFDDCEFSGEAPVCGPQPPPRPGVHNGRAVGSPGRDIVRQGGDLPELRRYLEATVARFAGDRRVILWDLYNEPGNRMIFDPAGLREYDPALERHSADLMAAAFKWARAINPDQPLTVGAWRLGLLQVDTTQASYDHPIDRTALELSDVLSFHAYCPLPRASRIMTELAGHGRPLVCTEWMARGAGSSIEEQLPLFRQRDTGSFLWGLVRGRTQTDLPWPHLPSQGHPDLKNLWFHDVFLEDGQPYDQREIEVIRSLTSPRPDAGRRAT